MILRVINLNQQQTRSVIFIPDFSKGDYVENAYFYVKNNDDFELLICVLNANRQDEELQKSVIDFLETGVFNHQGIIC